MNWLRMVRAARFASLLLLASSNIATLTGCGQKGPLYLPDAKPPEVQAPAPTPTGDTPPAPEKRDPEKEKPR